MSPDTGSSSKSFLPPPQPTPGASTSLKAALDSRVQIKKSTTMQTPALQLRDTGYRSQPLQVGD